MLRMLEHGQISAHDAAQLLDALEASAEPARDTASDKSRVRTIRLRLTNLKSRSQSQHLNVVGTMPVSVLRSALRFGTQLIPQLNTNAARDLIRSIDSGTTGRLLDLQDLERGERLEIFAE